MTMSYEGMHSNHVELFSTLAFDPPHDNFTTKLEHVWRIFASSFMDSSFEELNR